jgi:hypothetical protein
MNPNVRTVAAALSAAAFFATGAYAEEKEPLAVFEIGGAGNWTAPKMSSAGPTVAVEFTPIKDWLEIEIGTGPCLPPGQRIGVPTSSSKSGSIFRIPWNLWSELAPLSIRLSVGQRWSESRLRSILFSGLGRIESMAGSLSLASPTALSTVTNNRLA